MRPTPRHTLAALALALTLALAAGATLAQQDTTLYLPLVKGPPRTVNPTFTGEGTFYLEANGGGNCSFDPTPEDLMVGAMNETQYAMADLCGAYVELTGPNGTITVRIVDRCPECKPGDIDLSPVAFEKIAPRVAGRVPISWRVVSPPLTGPVSYHFKEGSSRWWLAVQVRNHRNPIAKLEYKNSAGAWVAVRREQYNYFVEPADVGPGPQTFRITDIYGNVLVDSGITVAQLTTVPGAGQFPPGP